MSEIVEVLTHNSEWNERCAIRKILQHYTKLRLTSIVRIGVQELQNGLGRKKKKSPRKKPRNTLKCSNPPNQEEISIRTLRRKPRQNVLRV